MALGTYFGAGGVKNLYRCYVGAGGVKTVTGIYIGVNGSVKRVWPSGLIYDAGTIYEPLTWQPASSSSGTERATITYGSSYITITSTKPTGVGNWMYSYLYTTSTLDMSLYNTLTVTFNVTECTTGAEYAGTVRVGVGSSTSSSGTWAAYGGSSYTTTGTRTVTVDLSSVTSSAYVMVRMGSYGSNTFSFDISHIELTA